MKLRLVANWRSAWKWWSIHCGSVGLAAVGTWAAIPTEFKAAVPGWALQAGAAALFALGMCARMVDQNKPKEAENVDADQ